MMLQLKEVTVTQSAKKSLQIDRALANSWICFFFFTPEAEVGQLACQIPL